MARLAPLDPLLGIYKFTGFYLQSYNIMGEWGKIMRIGCVHIYDSLFSE